jgi:glycerol-3-phosphate dehydrogenase subunit B
MRAFEALRTALRAAGGRLVLGSEVIGADRDGGRVTAVATNAAGHDAHYHARWFVLATGGFASGGIALGSDWVTSETALGLPLRGVPNPGEPRFVGDYLAEQPMARVGVAVDASLRAEGTENVLVAGAALPGAVPWREGSGEGIALSSGHRAAEIVLGQEASVSLERPEAERQIQDAGLDAPRR